MRKYYINDFLFRSQWFLFEYAPHALRAVILQFNQKEQYGSLTFFFDQEVTDDLFQIAAHIHARVTIADMPWEAFWFDVIALSPPFPCLIQDGYLIYHRYEPGFSPPDQRSVIAPFTHERDYPIFAGQQILLGLVMPSLKSVIMDYEIEKKRVLFWFKYNEEITEILKNLVISAIHRARGFFPKDVEIRHKIEKIDFVPKGKNISQVYRRKES